MKFIKRRKHYDKIGNFSYEPIISLSLKKIEKNAWDQWRAEDGTYGLSLQEIQDLVSKNCYIFGKKSENTVMVCINGSENAKRAFDRAIKKIGPNDHLILITIRDLSNGNRRYSLVARWRLLVAAKQILSEYEDRLLQLNENYKQYNYTLLYPEVYKNLPIAIAAWAKKIDAKQIFMGTNPDLEKYLQENTNAKIRSYGF